MENINTLKEQTLIDAGFRKRIRYENADMYKVFSILYGLVLFIGGVSFSISDGILSGKEAEIIKHLSEIYFSCLYWISIIWIIFCIIDIQSHRNRVTNPQKTLNELDVNEENQNVDIHSNDISQEDQLDKKDDNRKLNSSEKNCDELLLNNESRDVLSRRYALDPVEENALKRYVRHRRDSIVEHVIGYSYDENSTVGGLYTRVGIGIFSLGTVVHGGLAILSHFEYGLCIRWTTLIDDLSRIIFSFIQFFFIFKNSNLIIRAHENLARLAIIHIVVTNLCVWFRMVVIETKLQIMEVNNHQISFQHSIDLNQQFHNESENGMNIIDNLFIFGLNCSKFLKNDLSKSGIISEGYMKLKGLLYPCTIEFSLMSLTLFFLIWENIGKRFSEKICDRSSRKNVFMLNCHASIKGLFVGMIVFSCTLLSIIVYAVFRNEINAKTSLKTSSFIQTNLNNTSVQLISKDFKTIDYSIVILEFVNLCLLIISLSATICSLIKIRQMNYHRTTTRFDDVLIIVSLAGTYLFSIFSAFAIISNLNSSTWFAYVKVVVITLEFIEGTVHGLFILMGLRKRQRHNSKDKYPAREMITLLIIVDLSLWFEKTTTTTKHEANPFQLSFYHIVPWSIIAAIATPLQIFFRFHASVCLSHIWTNIYNLPIYQTRINQHI